MTAQRSDDSEGAAPMGPRAWGMHVVAVLRDPEPHRRLLAGPARAPFPDARRHVLVDLEVQEVRAEAALVAGFKALCSLGIRVSDGQNSTNYLPARLLAEGLARGFSSADLGRALRRLLQRGVVMREVIGQHRNHRPKSVLQLANHEAPTSGDAAQGARQHPNDCGAQAAIQS